MPRKSWLPLKYHIFWWPNCEIQGHCPALTWLLFVVCSYSPFLLPWLSCDRLRPLPAGIFADSLPQLLLMCWQSPGFHLVLLLTVHVLRVILATLTASMSRGLKMTPNPCLWPSRLLKHRQSPEEEPPSWTAPITSDLTPSHVVQSLSCVQLFAPPWTAALQVPLSFTISPSLLNVHLVGDAIQPSHPLSPPSPPALSLSHHQGLTQWVGSLHQAAKVFTSHFSLLSSFMCGKTLTLSLKPHTCNHLCRPR